MCIQCPFMLWWHHYKCCAGAQRLVMIQRKFSDFWIGSVSNVTSWNSSAPPPFVSSVQDLIWENAHLDVVWQWRREWFANVILTLGLILWSLPVSFIQALASVQSLSKIPGLHWTATVADAALINSYLPVVAMLGLIMILPIVFRWVAENFEHRKKKSSVERLIIGRFFYYQLANIFITVTTGISSSKVCLIITL